METQVIEKIEKKVSMPLLKLATVYPQSHVHGRVITTKVVGVSFEGRQEVVALCQCCPQQVSHNVSVRDKLPLSGFVSGLIVRERHLLIFYLLLLRANQKQLNVAPSAKIIVHIPSLPGYSFVIR